MAGGVVLLRPEHRSGLKHPVEYPHHGLLVKLRALTQLRLLAEVIQLKNVGTALRAPGYDLGGADLREVLAQQIVPKASDDTLLNLEFCTLPQVAQGDGAQGQLGLQGCVQLPFAHRNGERGRRLGQNPQLL